MQFQVEMSHSLEIDVPVHPERCSAPGITSSHQIHLLVFLILLSDFLKCAVLVDLIEFWKPDLGPAWQHADRLVAVHLSWGLLASVVSKTWPGKHVTFTLLIWATPGCWLSFGWISAYSSMPGAYLVTVGSSHYPGSALLMKSPQITAPCAVHTRS